MRQNIESANQIMTSGEGEGKPFQQPIRLSPPHLPSFTLIHVPPSQKTQCVPLASRVHLCDNPLTWIQTGDPQTQDPTTQPPSKSTDAFGNEGQPGQFGEEGQYGAVRGKGFGGGLATEQQGQQGQQGVQGVEKGGPSAYEGMDAYDSGYRCTLRIARS